MSCRKPHLQATSPTQPKIVSASLPLTPDPFPHYNSLRLLTSKAMKLLTVNFLTCAIKSCKSSPLSFPLHFRDAELEQQEIEYNPIFLQNILPRLDWDAVKTTAAEVCVPSPPIPSHPSKILRPHLKTKKTFSSVSLPSLRSNRVHRPRRRPRPRSKECEICTRCCWRRRCARERWYVGIAGMSIRSRRGLRISCSPIISVSSCCPRQFLGKWEGTARSVTGGNGVFQWNGC